MEQLSFGQILLYSFSQSDAMGKAIVLLLCIASIWAWTVIINKWRELHKQARDCQRFIALYSKLMGKSPLLIGLHLNTLNGPLKDICRSGLAELFKILNIAPAQQEGFLSSNSLPRRLTPEEVNKIRSTMTQTADMLSLSLDADNKWFSILITISPYLGLFGTVWGVMATFISIARQGKIEITAIAPGISGALLTTVAGLFVAIPTVFANAFINDQINKINQHMEAFVDNFISTLQLEE